MKKILAGTFLVTMLLLLLTTAPVQAATLTIPIDKDAFVYEEYPDRNYGDNTNLIAGFAATGYYFETFIDFDLGAISPGSTINSAELRLYYLGNEEHWYTVTHYVRKVIGPWEEETLTWNNQPISSSDVTTASVPPWLSPSWVSWNITSLVQDWVNGTYFNYGLSIWGTREADFIYSNKIFASSDYVFNPELRPVVVIDYTPLSVQWLDPLNHTDTFTLQDGTTLPIKFSLADGATGQPLPLQSGISLQITDIQTEEVLVTYSLGEGRDSLRWNEPEYSYIANLQTRNYSVNPDNTYRATVLNNVGGTLDSILFEVNQLRGVGRGK